MIVIKVICDNCHREKPIDALTLEGAKKMIGDGNEFVFDALNGGVYCNACAVKRDLLQKCPGGAHKSGLYERCTLCRSRPGYIRPTKGSRYG